jgi:hypothetical protein
MAKYDEQESDMDEEDVAAYAQLDELEKLETIIAFMEELGITTLDAARTRYTTLERIIDTDGDDA